MDGGSGSVEGGRRIWLDCCPVGVAERPITTSSSSSFERTLLGRDIIFAGGCGGAASAVAIARGSYGLGLGS